MASVGAKIRWKVPPEELVKGLDDYVDRLLNAALALASFFAAKIEATAKANAPWTDRTGNARQGLTARAFRSGVTITILLFHTMAYGIWLEVKNAGKFAVILKTLETFYPEVMRGYARLVGGTA